MTLNFISFRWQLGKMSFAIALPNFRLTKAYYYPLLHDGTISQAPTSSAPESLGFSPLRPLPTPPTPSTPSYRPTSIRPLPAVPGSRCGSPEDSSHGSSGTDSDQIDSSPSLGDLPVIPPSLRPGALKAGRHASSPHTSGSLQLKKEAPIALPSPSLLSLRKKRPQLQIKIEPSLDGQEPLAKKPVLKLPGIKRRLSLDSLTQRTPCLISPDQALSPVVSRRSRRSSQQPITMMTLSVAVQKANTAARLPSPLSSGKRATLLASDEDLLSLPRSPLLFNLSETPENVPLLR
jgi:hypothetical protein